MHSRICISNPFNVSAEFKDDIESESFKSVLEILVLAIHFLCHMMMTLILKGTGNGKIDIFF